MNMRPRPSTLAETCGYNRSGRALTHRWAPPEWFGLRAAAGGEMLRLQLVRCYRCSAFVLRSRGGDEAALDDLLEFAHPIPEVSAWISPEQPGHEVCCALPPRHKRRKQRAPRKRREAA